ncbi:hypothetical protein [Flavobacterium chungangensis]|uniref:CRISPR-associated endonuclease Cas2 n=1 Tax=Flavobacterium chungangensis TaxID=2708132 RepID=A0ABV8ZA43_9FLAO
MEIWHYKNPFTRYTQKYLKNMGEFGLKYETLFESTVRTESATVERMLLEQYEAIHGVLPAGNKVRF